MKFRHILALKYCTLTCLPNIFSKTKKKEIQSEENNFLFIYLALGKLVCKNIIKTNIRCFLILVSHCLKQNYRFPLQVLAACSMAKKCFPFKRKIGTDVLSIFLCYCITMVFVLYPVVIASAYTF